MDYNYKYLVANMNELGAMVDAKHGNTTERSSIASWSKTVEGDLDMITAKDSKSDNMDEVNTDDVNTSSNPNDMIDYRSNTNEKSVDGINRNDST